MAARLAMDIVADRALVSAGEQQTVRDAAVLMLDHHCGSVAVLDEGGRLSGIFTESDLATRVVARGLDPDTTRIAEVMTRDPDRLGPEDSVADAIRKMHECGYQHLPMMKGDKPVAMLSWRDLPMDDLSVMQGELDERTSFTERMR
ncbi:MAG: CBS domain-containing protein [Geminicoccaceae bacterium]